MMCDVWVVVCQRFVKRIHDDDEVVVAHVVVFLLSLHRYADYATVQWIGTIVKSSDSNHKPVRPSSDVVESGARQSTDSQQHVC